MEQIKEVFQLTTKLGKDKGYIVFYTDTDYYSDIKTPTYKQFKKLEEALEFATEQRKYEPVIVQEVYIMDELFLDLPKVNK